MAGRTFLRMLSYGFAILGGGAAFGQTGKPMHIVTSGVGGSADFTARLIAQGITGPLDRTVIVDNQPSSVIQAVTVAKAPPDGSTLLVAGSTFLIGPFLETMPYDPVGAQI